jgi:hypothetical protein
MQIIGAGFGRTGTTSTRLALNYLGFGPCYHMVEVFLHPSHIAFWQDAADGKPVDWGEFFADYPAGIDYPLSAFSAEIIAAFPDAKVIVNVRDPESWWESTAETIYGQLLMPDWLIRLTFFYRGMKRMVQEAVWERLFRGRFLDKEYAIRIFEDHIESMKALVPADRLLLFDVRDGWEPLCEFLEVELPSRPFPHSNQRWMIRMATAGLRLAVCVFPLLLIGLIVYLSTNIF